MGDEGYKNSGTASVGFKVNGQEFDCSAVLISVETACFAGKVATAKIVLHDNPDYLSESDSDGFPIGSKVEISFGRDGDLSPVFRGIVAERSLRLGEDKAEVTITVRHEAFKMTMERQFVCYESKKDTDIISAIAGNYGIKADIGDTTATHEKIVQYNCSDWDFINMRAEASGLVLCTTPDGIVAQAPDLSAEPVMTISNGYTLTRLEIGVNGHDRFKSIAAEAWNYSSREMDSTDTDATGGDTEQGTDKTAELASGIGNEAHMLRLLSGQVTPDAMEQMVQAQAMRTGLSRITGKVSALGFAGVKPLDMVALDGVGKRFGGNALVTAVIQSFSRNGWETTLGLGLEDIPFRTRYTDIDSPGADGVMPPTHGLQSAVVDALEGDPQGEERIRVKLMGSDTTAIWARVAIPYAGDGRGLVFMPEVGDEVIVGFMGGNPSEAVVLGSLHGSAAPPPCDKSDDNDIKTIVTREGVKIEFDDKKKHVVIETPGGNSITVSDDEKSVLVKDQNGNKVTLSSDGIVLDSAKDVAVKAKGDVNIEGTNVNLKANAQLAAKGSASAEISSSGNTVVKGSIVQIN